MSTPKLGTIVPTKILLLITGLVVGFLLLAIRDCGQREVGKRDELLRQASKREAVAIKASLSYKARSDSLVKEVELAKAHSKVSGAKFTNARIVYRNLRDTMHIEDSVAVSEALELADSLATAGDIALSAANDVIGKQGLLITSLRTELSARDSIAVALRNQNAILRKAIPRMGYKSGVVSGIALTIGLVYAANKLTMK